MTKQQAPHSQERCAGVPGHKKDAAAGEGNLSTTLSLPRGTQGLKTTDFIVRHKEKTAPTAQHPCRAITRNNKNNN